MVAVTARTAAGLQVEAQASLRPARALPNLSGLRTRAFQAQEPGTPSAEEDPEGFGKQPSVGATRSFAGFKGIVIFMRLYAS